MPEYRLIFGIHGPVGTQGETRFMADQDEYAKEFAETFLRHSASACGLVGATYRFDDWGRIEAEDLNATLLRSVPRPQWVALRPYK